MFEDVDRDDVMEALARFDRDLRSNDNWRDWEKKESQKYALEHDGRLYPPKMILSLAAGVPVGSFSGGLQGANRVLAEHGFHVVTLAGRRDAQETFNVFWVNQGTTYTASRDGGFLWAPKRTKNGVTPGHWKRMLEVRPSDVIVHYSDGAVRAIGRAKGAAVDANTPFEEAWEPDGRRIDVEYFELGDREVTRARVAALFGDFELDEGPFSETHGVKQGYLWRFTVEGLQRLKHEVGEPWPEWADVDDAADVDAPTFELARAAQLLTEAIAQRGFIFEPWQIAAFVTALRTKPFVILAGVSGTGKSRLPSVVAEVAGCTRTIIPVRPDWTDSSDILGYVDLQGAFRPGSLLRVADDAMRDMDHFHLCIVDEMNLARVEHYFAEVLSRIESRSMSIDGRLETLPLLSLPLPDSDAKWGKVRLPSNLAIVGTVNMDESAHGFSRKVLDRAFTLELSDVDLRQWGQLATTPSTIHWPVRAWSGDQAKLAERAASDADRATVQRVVDALVEANAVLAQAQVQVGYRTRDEVALFVLNAADVGACFVTRDGAAVDPLDLALLMKVLPRIAGGSAPVRQVVLGLLGFAMGTTINDEPAAESVALLWRTAGRPAAVAGTRFPRTAARLCLMWDRLVAEGFTSFWL